MKVLSRHELHAAQAALLQHLPKSYKMFGFLHGLSRTGSGALEVVVDSWPDFKVILCRPDPKDKQALKFNRKVSCFSVEREALRRVLSEQDALDWSSWFLFGALDLSYVPLVMEVSSSRQTNCKFFTSVHLLYLPDISHLTPVDTRELESRVSSLNLSHVELVNQTWKFGGSQASYNTIENLISHFPSCCIVDEQNQPVSWILMYDYCAMGMLYTLPEHRNKGYAKVVITSMAQKLSREGYPMYCFIEEDNNQSYKLFKGLGFIDDPSYRAAWLEINF